MQSRGLEVMTADMGEGVGDAGATCRPARPRVPAGRVVGVLAAGLVTAGLVAGGCTSAAPHEPEAASTGQRPLPRPEYKEWIRLSSPGDRGAGFDPADLLAMRPQRFVPPKEAVAERFTRPWTFQGPANYAGKVMDLAVTPLAPATLYAAYGVGGVWRTTDDGASWTRMTDLESANYTSSVAVAPSDPDTVFVGLGTPGWTFELERGVVRTTDGGASWKAIGPLSPDADAIFDILVDPVDPERLIVATEAAVFVTKNGGASWSRTLRFPGEAANWWSFVSQLVAHPTDARIAWVTQQDLGVFKTTDRGATWQRSDHGIGPGGGLLLAVSPSHPDRLYVERENAVWPKMDLYRSDDGGESWTHTTVVDYFHQGRYDMAISVDPTDPDRVFIANVAWMESTDAAKSFTNFGWRADNSPGGAPHADHLAVAWRPGDPTTIYSGNDGGVWRSRDGGVEWEKIDQGVQSNLSFNLGVDPNSDRLYLTSGDYAPGQATEGSVDWWNFPGYEWQFYEVDPHDSNVVYTSTGTHRLLRVEDDGAIQTPVDPCPGQGMRYDRVVTFDPVVPDVVYAGCLDLRRSADRGESWTSISPVLAENPNYGLIDFAVSPTDPQVLWVLTERLHVSRDGGATWSHHALPAYPQDLAVDPHDPSVVYVSAAFEQMRRYTDWGSKTEQLWGNLPSIVRRVVPDPSRPGRLFAATDVGVFVSPRGDGVWHRLGEGLPRVHYWDLDLEGTTLYASGPQGVWRYDLTSRPCTSAADAMCLGEDRFTVEVDWRDFAGQTGSAKVVPVGSVDSGLFYFFSANNWEMLVKVLDGCSRNGHYWVFAAATTTVEYTLRVTDTESDLTASYFNPLGQAAPAITDTEALAACVPKSRTGGGGAVRPAASERAVAEVAEWSPERVTKGPPGPCAADGTALCLADGRFELTVDWRDFAGDTGPGTVVPAGSVDSGLFWFFSKNNWEMLVKVLDGCSRGGHHWIFSAATTTVEYRLHVRDTVTGEIVTYLNELGAPARALADTTTLGGCPEG